jgi:ion channel-forming bestrophin family protein
MIATPPQFVGKVRMPIQLAGFMPSLNVGRRIAGWMVAVMAYTTAVTYLDVTLGSLPWKAGTQLAATLGVVTGLLLVLRNNAANDRWWEARKAWGQLINESRNLMLKVSAFVDLSWEERDELGCLLSTFATRLMIHLRGGPLPKTLTSDQLSVPAAHMPGQAAGEIHNLLGRWYREGRLHETLWLLDAHARVLMDICGACERIRNTPLASSYRALLRWGLIVYITLAPWSVAPELGWWSIPVLGIGIGFLLGIELAAEAVEEPFGTEGDDLPLEKYCETIAEFMQDASAGVHGVRHTTCQHERSILRLRPVDAS